MEAKHVIATSLLFVSSLGHAAPTRQETIEYIEDKLLLYSKDISRVRVTDCVLTVNRNVKEEAKIVTEEETFDIDITGIKNVDGMVEGLAIDTLSDIKMISIHRQKIGKKITEKKDAALTRQLVIGMKNATYSERLEKALNHLAEMCRSAYKKEDIFSK